MSGKHIFVSVINIFFQDEYGDGGCEKRNISVKLTYRDGTTWPTGGGYQLLAARMPTRDAQFPTFDIPDKEVIYAEFTWSDAVPGATRPLAKYAQLYFREPPPEGTWNYLGIAWKEKKVGSRWCEAASQWYGHRREGFVPERDAPSLLPR